ncbi:MAG: class F sortase, partial [Chloroflexi bacterium]|nr:class F sortase [Chloroflexota bacterium]
RLFPPGQPIARWATLGIAAGVLVGILVAVVVASSGGDGGEGDVVITPVTPAPTEAPAVAKATATPPPPDPTSAATATPPTPSTPTPTPTATPAPDDGDEQTSTPPEPAVPTVGSLSELNRRFGEAPDATLGRLRIPVLGVDAPLGQRYVSAAMPNPTGPGDVVWYDFSEWDGLGGVPGGGANAVFSGHVDYNFPISWAEAYYRGEGVFYDLQLLSPGDVIEVEVGGKVLQYAVMWTRQVKADDSDNVWLPILTGDVAKDSITLITCGGDFDTATKTYADRFIVRAERV